MGTMPDLEFRKGFLKVRLDQAQGRHAWIRASHVIAVEADPNKQGFILTTANARYFVYKPGRTRYSTEAKEIVDLLSQYT